MNQQGNQHISCSVDSCKHYAQGDGCSLQSIHVSQLVNTAQTAEESMCQSFERKEQQ